MPILLLVLHRAILTITVDMPCFNYLYTMTRCHNAVGVSGLRLFRLRVTDPNSMMFHCEHVSQDLSVPKDWKCHLS